MQRSAKSRPHSRPPKLGLNERQHRPLRVGRIPKVAQPGSTKRLGMTLLILQGTSLNHPPARLHTRYQLLPVFIATPDEHFGETQETPRITENSWPTAVSSSQVSVIVELPSVASGTSRTTSPRKPNGPGLCAAVHMTRPGIPPRQLLRAIFGRVPSAWQTLNSRQYTPGISSNESMVQDTPSRAYRCMEQYRSSQVCPLGDNNKLGFPRSPIQCDLDAELLDAIGDFGPGSPALAQS
uniref:Uncharacterized protein n=1 Tax=Mycena chlorophos TaxID=658473 RepID=A0ABQ0M500_MYCCL|nr:predicted protein [Mycena chlorophos]